MILVPYSFYGTSLQSSDYDTSIPRASANLQIQTNPSYIRRAGAVPVFSGKEFQPVTLNLDVQAVHDFMTVFESLNQLFDTKDETPRQLICTDSEDSDKQYYVYATAKQVLGGHEGNTAVVSLALDDPIWQSVTQNSQTFAITSATDSTSVTAAGNDYSYPIFEITPTTQPSTDYLYNMYCQVLPTSTDPWPARFVDVAGATDTTWDTAALVSGGKMQSAGQDIRVMRDGVFIDFWLNGINTTDTHVVVVADMPAASNMLLKTAIASSDTVTEVELTYIAANKTVISALPNSGRLILDASIGSTDTEEFTYTAKTVTATKLAFTINARNVRNTSAFSHAAGANVRFLPYDFTILYGNSTATAYVTDDTRKPIQAPTSRNSSFSYTNFWDENGTRSSIFTQSLKKVSNASLSRSDFYTSTNDEGDTDPATAMGLAAYTYEAGGVWRSDSVQLAWLGYFPDLVASVSASGEQFQTSASRPAPYLQAGKIISSFTNLWTVAAQSATDYSTWTTWTKASSDATIPVGTKYLRWWVTGTQTGTTDHNSKIGASSLTVGLTNYPHVMIRTEGANYKLDCTIRNTTTGDFMTIIYPMLLNETLYIDTDPDFPTAKHKGLVVNGAVSLSSVRSAWLKLQPGANTIGFESNLAAASNVTVIIKWRDRMNFM
jgi:hypothetical protein